MISNSLDIDYIHGDILRPSRMKPPSLSLLTERYSVTVHYHNHNKKNNTQRNEDHVNSRVLGNTSSNFWAQSLLFEVVFSSAPSGEFGNELLDVLLIVVKYQTNCLLVDTLCLNDMWLNPKFAQWDLNQSSTGTTQGITDSPANSVRIFVIALLWKVGFCLLIRLSTRKLGLKLVAKISSWCHPPMLRLQGT